VAEERFVDKELERNMDAVLKAVVMGRACRNASNIKNRQPVASMFIKGMELDDYYREIIKEELNVKEVQFTDDVRAFTTYSFKPQMRTVGPKYGKLLNKIKEVLLGLDGNAAMDELKAQGALHFQIDAEAVELKEEDLLIEMTQSEGYVSENDKDITVVLDTRLTEELLEEGFVRELISKFQTMRKEAGFEVTDRITISQSGSEKTAGILRKYEDTIKSEVMAEKLVLGEVKGYTKEWSINGETTALGVEK
jgi:isoleucyl-tRNA synthetase